jgi:hypothetical protein
MPFSSQARDLNLRGDGCQLGHVFNSWKVKTRKTMTFYAVETPSVTDDVDDI